MNKERFIEKINEGEEWTDEEVEEITELFDDMSTIKAIASKFIVEDVELS